MKPNNSLDQAIHEWSRQSARGDSSNSLSDRIANAAVRDFQFRRRVKLATRSSVVIIAIVAVSWIAWPRAGVGTKEIATRPIMNPLSETSQILTKAMKVDLPKWELPAIGSPLAQSPIIMKAETSERIFTLPERAKSSMDPVTAPVSKAANRWFKELNSVVSIPPSRM
jgi:hypothetical protein